MANQSNFPDQLNQPVQPKPIPPSPPPLTRGQKIGQMLIGFVSLLVVNGLMVLFFFLLGQLQIEGTILAIFVTFTPWVLNLALIVLFLLLRRPWMALGIVATFGLGLLLVLLAMLVFAVICFSSY